MEAKDVELKQLQEQLSTLQDNLLKAEQKLAEQVSLIQLWFHSRLIRNTFHRCPIKVLRAVHVRRKRLRLIWTQKLKKFKNYAYKTNPRIELVVERAFI